MHHLSYSIIKNELYNKNIHFNKLLETILMKIVSSTKKPKIRKKKLSTCRLKIYIYEERIKRYFQHHIKEQKRN